MTYENELRDYNCKKILQQDSNPCLKLRYRNRILTNRAIDGNLTKIDFLPRSYRFWYHRGHKLNFHLNNVLYMLLPTQQNFNLKDYSTQFQTGNVKV